MLHNSLMFVKVPSLQPMPVNRVDDRFEEPSKIQRNLPHLVVKGICQDIIVDVTQEVNQTLLLRTIHAVISTVKVGH